MSGAPQLSINGTHLTLSNLTLVNRGVYPLSVAIERGVKIDELDLGSTTTGKIVIPRGARKQIAFSIPIDLSRAYSDYVMLRKILFNGSVISFKVDVDVGLEPFVSASFSGGFNNSVGAALDGLTFRLHSVEPINATHLKADVEVEFTNRSPITIEGALNAKLSSIQHPKLEYSSSLKISAQPNQHYQGLLTFNLPRVETVRGSYRLDLSFESAGFTYKWSSTLEV
ncbi:MAG: hypothetical protein QW282_07375 [Nitrososphaerales archaeon]